MKFLGRLSLIVFAITISMNVALAQQAEKKVTPVRFLITGALEFGGDEVAEVYFTNGNTQSVKAGQGGSLGVGAQLQLPAIEQLLLRATVGFKYVTTEADNAHIRLTRVPIVLTGNFMASKRIRLGAGLAMHRSIRFKADGIGPDITFKPASGPTFEVAYRGIGLTYTSMKYKDQSNLSYSANSFGVSFSLTVPGK
jgi:hypothetical protein